MDEHNRRDYKGLGARENTHAGSLRILFQSPGYDRAFSRCPPDFLPATKGQRKRATDTFAFFSFTVRIPDLPKILTVREIFEHESPRYTKKSPGFSRKSNSYELARLREAISFDEFMRDIISRESRNFDLHLIRRPLLAEKFRRRRGFLGS